MIRFISLLCAVLLATPILAHDGPGRHEPSGHLDSRVLPACDAPQVLALIVEKASYQGRAPAQYPPLPIASFDHIQQTRHLGSMGPGRRERRWCQARAHIANAHARSVFYVVEGYAGFAGIRFGVESCIAGHDLWNVHGATCSTARYW